MEQYRIVEYTRAWHEKLFLYMHKTFPTYSKEYIEYGIEKSSGIVPSLLVVNNKEEVVGCHLYYCTKALLNDEVMDTQWGHDTYLDQDYRKEAGVGLTETNAKMRKLMKSVFLKGVFNYYTITPLIICSPLQKLLRTKKKVKDVPCITINGHTFRRVHSTEEMTIPNGGFWFKGYNNLDFIRDAEFLNHRFFDCKVHNYKIYASDDSYFVVRESSYRGMPAMMLSDFRYNPADFESTTYLLKAIRKLALNSGYGILYFVCGDKNVDQFFKRRIHYKTPMDFITSYKISSETTFTLSGGDSDAEFLKV